MDHRIFGVVLICAIAGTYAVDDGTPHPRPIPKCNPSYSSQQTCQNFARVCLNEINDQIRLELIASYTYEAMAVYFNRDDVAYRGFAKFFTGMADEEREHARKLQDYMNSRGGRVHYKSITAPKADWETPLYSLQEALTLEKRVNTQLLDLHWMAQDKNDPHLQNFLESEFLNEQVDSAKKLADWISVMTRMQNDTLGWTIFDEELYDGRRS